MLPFAAGGLVAEAAVALGLLTCPLAFLLLGELCEERPPARHSATRMTARTLTGVRSVDLNHIASVRLLTTFSYGGTYRALVVRDGHGVRLGVTSAGRRALNKARRTRRSRVGLLQQGLVPRPHGRQGVSVLTGQVSGAAGFVPAQGRVGPAAGFRLAQMRVRSGQRGLLAGQAPAQA
jgi:hypothetical protein